MMIYNIFTILPSFVILFWLILLIIDNKNHDLAKRYLVFFLGVMLVNYGVHWFYFNYNYKIYRYLDSIWVFTSLSAYPLFYYYIRILTVDKKINFKWLWILLPAAILSIYSWMVYMFMSQEEIERFIHEVLYHNRVFEGEYSLHINMQIFRINLFKIIFGIQILLTIIFGFRLINRFNKKVYAVYSNVENRELGKIKMLLLFFLFASIISFVSNFIGKDYFTDYPYLLAIPSLAHSIALFGICYVGYNQYFSVRDLVNDVTIEELEESSNEINCNNLVGLEYDRLYLKIKEMFEIKQLYKNPDLKMNDIAILLGTNSTYVSKLIHNRTNMSFCDFVNSYRIQHAEDLLSSIKEPFLSMVEVAIDSGFSGISTFYRTFVKKNGMPPGRYRKIKISHFVTDDVKGTKI